MAITVKQYSNDLKEIPAEKTKPRQQPGWITELKHRINSLRRKIVQLEIFYAASKTVTEKV